MAEQSWAQPERPSEESTAAPGAEDGGEDHRYDWWNPNDSQIDISLVAKTEERGQEQISNGKEATLLTFDWLGFAKRCAGTASLSDDPEILKDLSGAFNAMFGSGDLSLAAGEALTFADQAFFHMEYAIQQQKDGGWIASVGSLRCQNDQHLALAIYGAACLVLAGRRAEVEESAAP
jgi:hypothetical protein